MISSIEEGESSWDSSFGHYDMMCPPPAPEQESKGGRKKRSVLRMSRNKICTAKSTRKVNAVRNLHIVHGLKTVMKLWSIFV